MHGFHTHSRHHLCGQPHPALLQNEKKATGSINVKFVMHIKYI